MNSNRIKKNKIKETNEQDAHIQYIMHLHYTDTEIRIQKRYINKQIPFILSKRFVKKS